jgi:hypothetical protein
MNPGRYHLTLAADGRPMMHGWWGSERVARNRFRDWIGERGSMAGARITLVDEKTGETLTNWPDET